MAARKKQGKRKGPGDDLLKADSSSSNSKKPSLSLGGQLGGSKRGFGGGIGGSLDIPVLNRKKTSVAVTADFGIGGYKNKGGSSGYSADFSPGVRITRTIGKKKRK